MALITIDFHNTLFRCDDWFRLEVETLPVSFFEWREHRGAASVSYQTRTAALGAYREIRTGVTSSGRECDAESCIRRVCDIVDLKVADAEVTQGVRQIMHSTLAMATPIDGAQELVRRLQDEGHTLAVISSAAYHPFLEWALERFEMLSSFADIVTSASCGIYKSNPEIYRYALERLGFPADEAVHIGDSPRFDVGAAKAVGMRTVLFTGSPEAAIDPQPDATIASLAEAPDVLDRLLLRHQTM